MREDRANAERTDGPVGSWQRDDRRRVGGAAGKRRNLVNLSPAPSLLHAVTHLGMRFLTKIENGSVGVMMTYQTRLMAEKIIVRLPTPQEPRRGSR